MPSSEAFFRSHPVFRHEEYVRSRGPTSRRTVDSLLRRHVASGRIARVRRGLYVWVPPGMAAAAADPFLIATKAAPDAVVSHHAALQFHGRAYSVWNQVTFFSRHATRPFQFGPTSYVPVRPPAPVAALPDMGGGVVRIPSGGSQVRVCSCERALVDVLHSPALGGGWEEIWRSLEMVEFFDLDAVIPYALALKSATTVARVGFFLEQRREQLFVEDSHLERLAAHAPNQARYFDSRRTPGQLVQPWKLIVPERVLSQSWEEAG